MKSSSLELRLAARSWLTAEMKLIEAAVEDGALIEVNSDGSDENP